MTRRSHLLLAAALCSLLTHSAVGATRREKGKGIIQRGEEVLFRIEFEKIRGAQEVETYLFRHLNKDKSLAIEERTELKNKELAFYSMKNRQSGVSATLKIANGEATYTRVRDGKTDIRKETIRRDIPTITGPQISAYIASQGKKLAEKGIIRFLLPVLDRAESIEFEIIRKDEVVHEMRPCNPLYQMFVRKIMIEFDPKAQEIRQIYGRIMPMVKNGSDWQPVEAMLVYSKS